MVVNPAKLLAWIFLNEKSLIPISYMRKLRNEKFVNRKWSSGAGFQIQLV